MREIQKRQFLIGQVPIDKIEIDPKSRDDIPALLRGLQHVWREKALRDRLFALLNEHACRRPTAPSDALEWSCGESLVLGVLKQGLGCDFDRLHDLANHHGKIRELLRRRKIS